MDDDVIDKKLELLDIDSLMSLQQAASAGNEDEVKKILSGTTKISKSDIKVADEPTDDAPTTTTINKYNIGDEVLIGTEGKEDESDDDKIEGSIKIPSAPHGTVGVLIDGELQMVDKKLVKRDTRQKTNEAFADDREEAASMADSIDADPMAEPADETPTDTAADEAGADDMGVGDMSSYGTDDYDSEEEADGAADDANDGYLDRIKQLSGINTPSLAAGPVQSGFDSQPEVVSNVPLSVPSVGSDAMSEILASIDAIEQKINDVRLSDFRPIYTRVESMLKNIQATGRVAVVEGEKKGLFAFLREEEVNKKSK